MQFAIHIRLIGSLVLLLSGLVCTSASQDVDANDVQESDFHSVAYQRQLEASIAMLVREIGTMQQGLETIKTAQEQPEYRDVRASFSGRLSQLQSRIDKREMELAQLEEQYRKLSGDQSTRPVEDSEVPSVMPDLNTQKAVSEIVDLRESLGGSVVGSVLGDMVVDGLSQEQLQVDFQNELARLVEEGQNKREVALPPVYPAPYVRASAEGELAQAKNVSLNGKVEALRAVSRQLEQLAWELEEVQAFADADRLRQQAADLRQQSRDLVR